MKFAVSFLLGASIGAIVALLFAPSSGEELRTNIKTQADVQAAKARDEWKKSVQGIQERVGKINNNPKTKIALPTPTEEVEAVA